MHTNIRCAGAAVLTTNWFLGLQVKQSRYFETRYYINMLRLRIAKIFLLLIFLDAMFYVEIIKKKFSNSLYLQFRIANESFNWLCQQFLLLFGQ